MRRLKCLLLLTNSTTADVNVSYYVLIGDFIERLWVCSESKEHIIDETRSYQNVVRLNVPHVVGLYLTRRTYPSTSTRRSVFFHIICI